MSTAANGLDFDVSDTGTGDPTLVFIHGLACDATAWAPQVADLSRDHRCVSLNLRGRGATPATPPFDVEQQASDAAAILDAAGVSRAIIVGHSLGGVVALLLNETRPDLVGGIVMGDSPIRARGLDGRRIVDSVREAGSTAPAAALVEGFWHPEATSAAVKDDVRAMMLGCPPEVLAGMLDKVISGDRMLELVKAADRKPFMAIWAETPAGEPAWLREHTMFLRQEPLVAGHFFQLELPDVTNALLRAFLEEAERDPRAF